MLIFVYMGVVWLSFRRKSFNSNEEEEQQRQQQHQPEQEDYLVLLFFCLWFFLSSIAIILENDSNQRWKIFIRKDYFLYIKNRD